MLYLQELLQKKKVLMTELYLHQNQIHNLEIKIKKLNEEIYRICNHDWTPDRDNCNNDRTTYICTICSIYK